ncbi:hypothetical protein CWE09_06775 [Aliidiomarina minuta]|uniref:Flagellar protein FlgN n=1 Tax=Aliidiomarina minuta TaxID=880057 RepID=A0A432W8J9_9GAMM|nr:flagellar protein FlgN [Aliidiomarina minuta]RUO26405.1 hypothetical protein CWE09_06775 [Aliidiomarina minuta]
MVAMLGELLDQQADQLQQLIDLQAAEKEALIKRDAPVLDQITEDKEKILNTIQQVDKSIAEHPQHDAINHQPELLEKRTAIQQLMDKCQLNNEVNGQVVRMTLGRIQDLKQTLQATQSGTTITYTDKGKTYSGPSGKSIKA